MEPISRRSALALGVIGVASAAVGGAGLASQGWPPFGSTGTASGTAGGTTLVQPRVLRARGGLLEVDLTARWATLDAAGRPTTVMAYRGTLPGPTMSVAPGDILRVRLQNELEAPTNLHVHGLHVPPTGPGDDPLVRVEPGDSHQYEYRIPDDHPEGLYWYHPHHHGSVADQVSGGLFGAILVGKEPPADPDRVLIISDLTVTASGRVAGASGMDRMIGREGDLLLLNGQTRPVLESPAGARQRWHILNACVSRYLQLEIPGTEWTVTGHDGRPDPEPTDAARLGLAPGSRAEVLVTIPSGTSTLQTRYVDRGAAMHATDRRAAGDVVPLCTLVGRTSPTAPSAAPAAQIARPRPRDLRAERVVRSRLVRLGGGMGRGMGSMEFTIDGRQFDAGRSDFDVAVGSVEEWTFENATAMRHPMHLHVWPMQVVALDGDAVEDVRWRDVVDVPAGGSTRVRISFDDYPGATVVHCHVLDHEDLGMMAVVTAS